MAILPVDCLGLPPRVVAALKRPTFDWRRMEEVVYLTEKDLREETDKELLRTPGIGVKALVLIRAVCPHG